MPNPFFSNRVTPNNTTQPSEPVNEAHKKYSRGYSTFDLSVPHFMSARYADLTPHEVFECVEGDRMEISNSHNIRSDAFVGPFMNDVTMRKSYFAVDYRAFLPNSWKYIYPLSIDGDDIPIPEVNTVIVEFHNILSQFHDSFSLLYRKLFVDNNFSDSYEAYKSLFFKYVFLYECFFSEGSLLRYLRSNFYTNWLGKDGKSFDELFDQYVSSFSTINQGSAIYLTYIYDSHYYRYSFTVGDIVRDNDFINVDFRTFCDILRDHPDATLTFTDDSFIRRLSVFYQEGNRISDNEFQDSTPFNYSRVCAYQLVCAQFFTNDKIDFIQSAHEYLDNMSYIIDVFNQVNPDYFHIDDYYTLNNIRVRYDVLSGMVIKDMFNSCIYIVDRLSEDLSNYNPYYANYLSCLFIYIMNLFTFRRNLRYGDYFTGARSNPLAVGDVTTPVVSGQVSTLDTTRNLLIQRFRNAVNRVGDRLSDYIEGVIGGKAAPDVTLPRFLATISSTFKGYEVENTADEQGKIVTVLNSNDGKYVYEMESGEPCIVIGITSFMSQRIYAEASDRFFFHKDRYDFFNPFYQYAGDQEIYAAERNGRLGLGPFAYTLRHMEYKQRLPMAVGAFISNLPGYAFITDNDEGDQQQRQNVDSEVQIHISPDYIRSVNTEFDRFFPSLTGYSLSSYYHFYIKMNDNLIAHRRMEYSPSML